MKLKNSAIISLLAIFSMIAICFGTAIAVDYNGSASSENLAMRSPVLSASMPSSSAILARPIAPSSYCFNCLPSPSLVYTGKENYTVRGTTYTRYKLAVSNRDDYPASLFKPAPDLPPCGLNTNSAQTWVNIYNLEGQLHLRFLRTIKPCGYERPLVRYCQGKDTTKERLHYPE